MPFFRTKPPIDEDEFEWLLACFSWLRSVLQDADIRPELVLPDHPKLQSARTAPELFDAVRQIAKMENWPCRLEKVDVDGPDRYAQVIPESSAACGTFSVENGEAVIRYSSSMLRNPDALAATFAHELCHYLLIEAGDPPGGPELMEHATDCAAVHIGFGVMLANAARTFEQWSDGQMFGWRSSANGYLSEQSLLTATAIFAALHRYDLDAAIPSLKPYLQKDLKKSAKAIAKLHPDMSATLDALDLQEWR